MKKSVIWLVHIVYWALFGLLLLIFFFCIVYLPAQIRAKSVPTGSLLHWWELMGCFAILPGLISFYSAYTYLFKSLLSRQRFALFLTANTLFAFGAAVLGALIASMPFLLGPAFLFGDGLNSAIYIVLLMTVLAWINGAIGAIIKGAITWYNEIHLKDALLQQNTAAELALVKSQIDPHFLFNTINNIDVLITRKPEAASAYLKKLSGIMRFLLYETKDEQISLDAELNYLQQYIDLQKIRTSNSEYVNMKVQGNFEGKFIAPMVLLPFIENAFKHTEHCKSSSQIRVELHAENDKLIFICNNTFTPETEKRAYGGLGNSLIVKRLNLLYPDKHQLTIFKDEKNYNVTMELIL